MKMKKIIIALFLVCSFIGQSQTLMPVGPQVTTYSGMSRGYHFTSPVAFTMCGLFIPPDASSGTQDIRVVRFTAGAPPAFAGTTLAYTTLFTCTGVASTTTLSCSIPVAAGDIIGIYGTRSTGCINSYGNPNVATTIMGMPTTLQRSGTQNCIGTLMTWPLPIWSEVSYNIGRIYMFYNCCPTPTITAVASPTSICNGASVAILGGGATTYTWMPGSMSTASITVTPTVTTTYTLSGSTLGCTGSKTVSVLVNPTPTITATATNSVICLGGSTTLSGAGGSTYVWSGGVTNGVAFSPTVTTTYTVTGTSVSGCTNTAVKTITVNALPAVTVNSPTICAGQTATLTASGASTYLWSTGSASSSITVSPAVTTNYTVTGTSSGCSSPTITTVVVNPLPVVLVNSSTVCVGQTATLTASGATTFSWSTGSILNSITASPLVTTNYSVTGTSLGCSTTTVANVLVNPLPVILVNNPTICFGQTATLTATGASSFIWSTGAATNSLMISPTVNTSYTVTGNTLGCTASTVALVTVNPLPVVLANTATICVGQTATLTATGATSYLWNTGIGSNQITVSPASTTNYTVTGTSLGCSNSNTTTVTVNPLPIITVNSATICSGQSTLLSATGANTYVWSPAGSLTASTGAFVSANPSITTIYNVDGTSLLGCVNSTNVTVYVVATPTVSLLASPSSVCTGSISNLSAAGATNYLWSPGGAVVSAISVSPPSTTLYTVIGSNVLGALTCNTTQTVLVTIIPPATVTTSNSDSTCLGGSKVVYATGGDTYYWNPTIGVSNPNSSSTTVKPTATTVYTVTASTGGQCPGTGTVQIIVNPLPIVYAGLDTTINIDESYVLNGTGNVMVGFLSPNEIPLSCNFCSSLEVNPKVTTCYTLKGQNSHQCIAYDDVCITVTKDYSLFIPNAFSPNGDTDNELFLPVGYGVESFEMSIFDRWGNTVFKSTADRKGWDGSIKGKIAEQGVYIYRVDLVTMGGKEKIRTGHVTVLSKVK